MNRICYILFLSRYVNLTSFLFMEKMFLNFGFQIHFPFLIMIHYFFFCLHPKRGIVYELFIGIHCINFSHNDNLIWIKKIFWEKFRLRRKETILLRENINTLCKFYCVDIASMKCYSITIMPSCTLYHFITINVNLL